MPDIEVISRDRIARAVAAAAELVARGMPAVNPYPHSSDAHREFEIALKGLLMEAIGVPNLPCSSGPVAAPYRSLRGSA